MTAPLMPMRTGTRRIITVPPRPPAATGNIASSVGSPGARTLALLGADDLAWISELTAAIIDLAGEPWRVALDAIEAGTWRRPSTDGREPLPVAPRRLAAATVALRRLLTHARDTADLARHARTLLLGIPALDDAARTARVARVAAMLALTPDALERILWADIPRERPIELTRGRPSASEVAALANVGLLQRALARAHSVELVILGDPSPLLRGCAARGLIVTASERHVSCGSTLREPAPGEPGPGRPAPRDPARDEPAPGEPAPGESGPRETVLDITGPLALCHGTAVYGRALGSLVPLLSACQAFALTIRAESHGHAYELRTESPVLLPAAAPRTWALVERLARDLERIGAPVGIRIRRAPPVVRQTVGGGGALVCPDLGIEIGDRVVWLEVVGFWTPEYLARKLARYRAVGAPEVILCVDSTRACDDDDPPPGACVMGFERRIHAEPLLELLGLQAAG